MIMMVIALLFLLNVLTEYLLNKMMLSLHVIESKNLKYHVFSAFLRILWIIVSSWLVIPLPIVLVILFILLFINVIPYRERNLLINNFIMIIYLIYVSLVLFVICCAGVMRFDVGDMVVDPNIRILILSLTFVVYNIICAFLLRYRPELLWNEGFDRLKVVLYTRFLFICCIYQIFDFVVLHLYETSQVNYWLLLSGDILIMIMTINFLNYNNVFLRSEVMKKSYEESEILLAQQYFEKEELKKLSEYDSLTETYNRREISSIMVDGIKKGKKLVCVFIDLDGLKRTNDKYGHTYGDYLLKRFALECSKVVDSKGKLARVGGDEFLLVFFDQRIEDIENSIKELQLKLLDADDEKNKIYFSYGISYGEDTVDDFINIADQKMYIDKKRKR